YVSSAVYNFSVPASWISQHGISSGNIKLFKQINSSELVPLSTTLLGYNSIDNNYYYSAVSNSLSTYIVGFTTGNTIGTSAPLSLTLPSGYYTYFFGYGGLSGLAGTTKGSAFSDNWTTSVNYTTTYTVGRGSKAITQYNMSNIGYLVQKETGTVSNGIAPINITLVGVGANVILGNGATYTNYGSSTSLSLSYTVSTSNSFAIIILAAGGSAFSAAPTTTATGCSLSQKISSSTAASAAIFVCNSIAAGSYTASATTTKASAWSAAAYIFPPYSVTLDDSPSTGTITTNGNTYSSGNVIKVIGANIITANPPPSGSWSFVSWSVSNSVNLSISSPTSNPATLTVMGNGIVTASWNGITKFIETGLPTGTKWNVTYDSILNSSTTNTIVFSTSPGNYLFTVANQVVSGTTYVPSPSSGYLVAGNTTSITFSPAVCTISLTPNAINFGSLNANANIATVNAITDSNTGNVNAYMLVYGGNWIGPSQFGVSNTTWSALSGTSFATANHLTALAANTAILVPASGSNTIYFGLGVPGGAPAGSYTQTITIENSC
ncbi:MAG: hypothetical protein QW530_02645, partial [Candidatus Micrarchaeaceae archaeon]